MNLRNWQAMSGEQRQEWIDSLDFYTAAGLAQGIAEQMLPSVDLYGQLAQTEEERAFVRQTRADYTKVFAMLTIRALQTMPE